MQKSVTVRNFKCIVMNLNNIRNFVLFLFLWDVDAHRNETRITNNKKHKIILKHGLRNNSKSLRREVDVKKLDKLQKKLGKFSHDGRIETFYEPYWQSGEWVFLRVTTEKGETTPRETSIFPGFTPKKFRKWPMSIYRDCDLLCLNIYIDFYGGVCAQRFDTKNWKNEYKHFDNMCELERENCKTPSKRPMWYPIHREKFCDELTTFKLFPSSYTLIMERKSTWAPYEYQRTKTTTLITLPPRSPRTTKTRHRRQFKN